MMNSSLQKKVELIEAIQSLHQFNKHLSIFILDNECEYLKRHVLNLPRAKLINNPYEADIAIGSTTQLLELKTNQSHLIMSDDLIIDDKYFFELLLKGYFAERQRLLTSIAKSEVATKNLRILVITNLYPPQELGGYGRSIHDFVKNLSLLGNKIKVLTSDAPYLGGEQKTDKIVDRSLLLLGTYENGVHIEKDVNIVTTRNAHNCKILDGYKSSYKPDCILFGNLDMLGPDLVQSSTDSGIPCFHHHGFSNSCFSEKQIVNFKGNYFPIANSIFSAKKIQNDLPNFTPIPVIYPGVQSHLFSDLMPQPLSSTLHIGFAGLLIGAKGAHILIEALCRLKSLKVPFACQLAGGLLEKDYPKALIKICKQGNILDQVQFLGKLNRYQLRQFYIDNPIFVFPSIWDEPFGISQVEALSSGCLVISSGTGGAGESVHDWVNGRKFRTSDSSHLAEILYEIYKNPRQHEILRNKGRKIALSHFDTFKSSCKLQRLITQQISK